QRIEGKLGGGSEAARRCYGSRAAEPRTRDICEAIAKARHQVGRGMVAVMLRVTLKILHPEIGREVHYEAGSRIEDVRRHAGRLTVLQAEKDDILPTRDFSRGAAGKSGLGQRSQRRVNRRNRLSSLAPARHHTFGNFRMLQQQAQKLTGDVAGASDDGDFHRESVVGSLESGVTG
ncbi:MAG TPA: hypothetical protein VE420_10130, partial [Gemmatimonadales bacterium]|nr:hypothetical protein [Gemmatimonadales bacterium]